MLPPDLEGPAPKSAFRFCGSDSIAGEQMSKYEEIVALAREASADIRNYRRESVLFVEALASEWGKYLENDVYLVSAEDAKSDTQGEPKSVSEAISMEDDDYWHFGLALILFPSLSQYAIPLFFRKVKTRYELHIERDRKKKTFWLNDLKSESFQPFCEYLFKSIKEHFRAFKDFPESKPVLGFNAARMLKTSETSESE